MCVGGEEDWGEVKGAIASYLTVPQCPSHNLAPKTHKYPSLKNAMRITITVTVYIFSIDYLLEDWWCKNQGDKVQYCYSGV